MDDEKGFLKWEPIWIRRIARIWSAPIILYTFLLSAGYAWNWMTTGTADPYAVGQVTFIEMLPPVLLFISVIGLAIAWRWERFGAVIALGFQLLTIIVLLIDRPIGEGDLMYSLPYLLTIIAAVPGGLFWVYAWKSNPKPRPQA